jgi:predicted RNase H-like nuclease (RuvC/YqgF family)
VLNELKQRKEAIEQWEQDKGQVETKMTADEEKIVKLKQETVELKKKVEKRQAILSTLEGEKDV